MKVYAKDSKTYKKNAAEKYLDQTSQAYKKVTDKLEINPDDPLYVNIFKIFLKLVFITICLALSPFIIVGLIVTIIIVA